MSSRCGFVLAVLLVFLAGVVSTGEPEPIPNLRSFRITYVTNRSQVNYIVEQFRSELRRLDLNAGVIACHDVIQLIEEGVKNFSFGAVCTIQKGNDKSAVLMCDVSQHTKFTFGGPGSLTRDGVVSFTKKNCPPGR